MPIFSEGLLAEMAAVPGPDNPNQPVIKLSNNENPFGPCVGACDAVAKAMPQGSRYPVALRRDLTNRLAKLHDVSPEMVALGNGSGEILRMAAGAFIGPDQLLVGPHPTFEAIFNYASLMGVASSRIKQIPVTADFRHDVSKLTLPKAGLIYVCNPNNPTSSITPKKEIDSLVANLPSGAVLMVDEAYYHFADSPEYESAMKHVHAGKDVFIVRTFSKVYGLAGLRVGYAVGRPDIIERLRRQAMDNNTNAMGLQAALTSIDDADQVSRNRERNASTRRMVLDWLDRNKMKYAPAQANFIFFHTGREVRPMIDALGKRGVLVGRPFPPFNDWMRVSIGTPDEMKTFIREYERL